MRRVFAKESFFSVRPQVVFSFHERPDAFELLSPPDFAVDVESTATTLRPSEDIVRFTKRVMAIPFHFEMVHTVYRPPSLFVDEQLRGPFSSWKHEHQCIQGGWNEDPATLLQDRITYGHPLIFAGNFAVAWPLSKLFEQRHAITRRELAVAMASSRGEERKTVVVTGATGLIGGRIAEILVEKGERVILFSRNVEKTKKIFGDNVEVIHWDFSKNDSNDDAWKRALGEADGVIHLAGTPLFAKRWNPEFKRQMKESRTLSTRQLVDAIKASDHKPEVFLCASAVGVYGTNPETLANEESPRGDDLLADICVAWEKEAKAVEEAGVRSAQLRIGVVIDTRSGALKEMLPLFKFGLGGVLGRGAPWINWIHLEDAARIFTMALYHQDLRGAINVAAPHPVTNKTLAHTLAHVLKKPCLMWYPESLLKLGIGEAAHYASGGPRVVADRVLEAGYSFFFDDLEPALRSLLNRP